MRRAKTIWCLLVVMGFATTTTGCSLTSELWAPYTDAPGVRSDLSEGDSHSNAPSGASRFVDVSVRVLITPITVVLDAIDITLRIILHSMLLQIPDMITVVSDRLGA